MLSGLDFEVAKPSAPAAPNRADVACFVGFVARRSGVALPADVREQLEHAGWLRGPWDVGADRLDELLNVPVVLDGWDAFSRLFAWDHRPLDDQAGALCATYLGAAVRSFFAHGGRRAVVVRVGDPWPYLGGEVRADAREARLAALVPASRKPPRPFDATDPRTWEGVEHLYGLGEVSHVCLPDLADVCATEPEVVPVADDPPPAPEVFVECSTDEPRTPADRGLDPVEAPHLDPAGYSAWTGTVEAVRLFLASHRRDALCVTSLPLPRASAQAGDAEEDGARAQSDWLAFLEETGVLPRDGGGGGAAGAASAFVQMAWPWVRTVRSDDLPGRLEPPEGILAGILAGNALSRGTFRSVAGTALPEVVEPEPMPDVGVGPGSPAALLARRVCLIGPEPDGITLLSDVTGSRDTSWRPGGVSRLMATLLRAARRVGEAELFAANGPELWTRVRRSMEELLDGFLRAGALAGASPEEAYQVRCGRDTMTQSDLDNGRVRVEITVLPAVAVEHITVSLDLGTAGRAVSLGEVA